MGGAASKRREGWVDGAASKRRVHRKGATLTRDDPRMGASQPEALPAEQQDGAFKCGGWGSLRLSEGTSARAELYSAPVRGRARDIVDEWDCGRRDRGQHSEEAAGPGGFSTPSPPYTPSPPSPSSPRSPSSCPSSASSSQSRRRWRECVLCKNLMNKNEIQPAVLARLEPELDQILHRHHTGSIEPGLCDDCLWNCLEVNG